MLILCIKRGLTKALSQNKKKQVSRGKNCVKPHWRFATITLCLCGAVDWSFDSGDGERGSFVSLSEGSWLRTELASGLLLRFPLPPFSSCKYS